MTTFRVEPVDLSEQEIALFWSKTRSVENGCLEWTGTLDGARGSASSYGEFCFTRHGRHLRIKAHRVALYLATGTLGVMACHHCDNPSCVNTAHLYWGDAASNMQDKINRGRVPRGHKRSDWARMLVAQLRERGIEPAIATSMDMAVFTSELEVDARLDLASFTDRLISGDRLPELVA